MYPDSSRWIQVSSNLHNAAESSQFLNKLVVCDLLFVLDYICHYWNVNFLFSPSLCSAKLISKYYTPWNTAPWFTLVVLAVTWICHLNLLFNHITSLKQWFKFPWGVMFHKCDCSEEWTQERKETTRGAKLAPFNRSWKNKRNEAGTTWRLSQARLTFQTTHDKNRDTLVVNHPLLTRLSESWLTS